MFVLVVRVVLFPGVAGGVVSQAPIRRRLRACGAAAMTMCPGTGLLSQKIERGAGAGSCRKSELTRGLVTLPVWGCAAMAVLASHAAGPGARSVVARRCQARVSSLREIAMVAIFFPRRWAIAA